MQRAPPPPLQGPRQHESQRTSEEQGLQGKGRQGFQAGRLDQAGSEHFRYACLF